VSFVLRNYEPIISVADLRAEIATAFASRHGRAKVDVNSMALAHYQLVGEGFMEGLMFGDAWPYSRSRFGNLRVFVLH